MKRLFTKFKVSGQSELIALLDWRKPDTQLQRKNAQRWAENSGSSSSTINTRSLSSLTSCRHLPITSRSAKLLWESRRVCLQAKPTAIYQFWWTTQTRYPRIRRAVSITPQHEADEPETTAAIIHVPEAQTDAPSRSQRKKKLTIWSTIQEAIIFIHLSTNNILHNTVLR